MLNYQRVPPIPMAHHIFGRNIPQKAVSICWFYSLLSRLTKVLRQNIQTQQLLPSLDNIIHNITYIYIYISRFIYPIKFEDTPYVYLIVREFILFIQAIPTPKTARLSWNFSAVSRVRGIQSWENRICNEASPSFLRRSPISGPCSDTCSAGCGFPCSIV